MGIDTFSIALSGISAATTRMGNSSHNVANMLTEGFRNHRTRQVSSEGGGVRTSTEVDKESRQVDYAHEVVEQAEENSALQSSSQAVDLGKRIEQAYYRGSRQSPSMGQRISIET